MIIISNDNKPIKKHSPPPDGEISDIDVLLELFKLCYLYNFPYNLSIPPEKIRKQ